MYPDADLDYEFPDDPEPSCFDDDDLDEDEPTLHTLARVLGVDEEEA